MPEGDQSHAFYMLRDVAKGCRAILQSVKTCPKFGCWVLAIEVSERERNEVTSSFRSGYSKGRIVSMKDEYSVL